jgi:hypothetical protein
LVPGTPKPGFLKNLGLPTRRGWQSLGAEMIFGFVSRPAVEVVMHSPTFVLV